MTKPSTPLMQQLGTIPEIKSAVLGDMSGALSESVSEPDAETVAAIMGFTISTVSKAGELLGLGPVQRLSVSGPSKASIATVRGDSVLTTVVDQAKSVPGIEKKLDAILHR